jgi:putative nucleotidyltransferase with HDIG domain
MLATAKIDIESLVEVELPPLPGSALRVATLAQDINSSTHAIANAIGCDPILAARILRAANSPLYALERQVTTLPVAVNTMGNHAIHMFVMVYTAADAFNHRKGSKRLPQERALWEHSLAVGFAAREVRLAFGMKSSEEAFLCGLLHDIGKLLLLRHDAELYVPIQNLSDEQQMLEGEREVYGYTHAQVGAMAARRWGLPQELSNAIFYHHHPSEAAEYAVMARMIDVADALANAANYSIRPDAGKELKDLEMAESVIALNLSPEQLSTIWQKAETALRNTFHLFN